MAYLAFTVLAAIVARMPLVAMEIDLTAVPTHWTCVDADHVTVLKQGQYQYY